MMTEKQFQKSIENYRINRQFEDELAEELCILAATYRVDGKMVNFALPPDLARKMALWSMVKMDKAFHVLPSLITWENEGGKTDA